jgi:hypothetical protein
MCTVLFYNSLGVVHEVLSYASKQSGDRPHGRITLQRSTSHT